MPSYPPDILLPSFSKQFGIIDSNNQYNSNYDIVWSFEYKCEHVNSDTQYGIGTFLTSVSAISAFPGQYLGILGPSYSNGNIALSIMFDSTGYSTLSNLYNNGLARSSIKPHSLVIRDKNNVIYNQSLSTLDNTFVISESSYKTLRFRFCNFGKTLYIDYKNTNKYKNLLVLPLTSYSWMNDNTILYPGMSLCSPISSSSMYISEFYIKNFHTQGNISSPSYEYVEFKPLTSFSPNTYTILSGVTTNPI